MSRFGSYLAQRGQIEAAYVMLRESCLAHGYLLGTNHEAYKLTYHQLKEITANLGGDQLEHKWMGIEDLPTEMRERLAARAYKHIFLNNPLDLAHKVCASLKNPQWQMTQSDYVAFAKFAEKALKDKRYPPEHVRLSRLWRICHRKAGLPHPQGMPDEVFQGQSARTTISRLLDDLEKCGNDSSDIFEKSIGILKLVGFEGTFTDGERKAIHQKLVEAEITHFHIPYYDRISTLLFQNRSQVLGRGAYANVDTLSIGMQNFARKSIRLPRGRLNQQPIRDIIQNEVSVMRRLDHPNIVQVYLTYEETHSFHIVMYPLADCDLEAFLAQDSNLLTLEYREKLTLKWFACLSNTLAFIHAQGIRHKDLKPRNILIKKETIIFADFGSSRDFLDEGNSTTEGPAFGHTKMYCAPEVISGGSRGRPADIFSLGCIFADLLAWLGGDTISD